MLDTVYVELIITACQMEADNIWMQGKLEIRLNNERPYADSDVIDEKQFLKSLDQEGEFTIFSCCCGVPECSGWKQGIQVSHSDGNIKWTNPNNGESWQFSKQKVENDLNDLREELKNYKRFFGQKGIRYVGVGFNW
ncbi:hypothetical protein [Flavobacterium sp.]|uniref:hypothetical protein n=1 Tax=Flavobacterium sp. TaxID=239 RepID=UPI0039E36E5B